MKNLIILILAAMALSLSACHSKSRIVDGPPPVNCDEVNVSEHPECVVRAF